MTTNKKDKRKYPLLYLIILSIIILAFLIPRVTLINNIIQTNSEDVTYALHDDSQYHDITKILYYGESDINTNLSAMVRTPAYSGIITLGYYLFGPTAKVYLFTNIIFEILALILIYLIAKELFKSKSIALISLALYSLNPAAPTYLLRALSEVMFLCLLLASIYWFIKYLKEFQKKWIILAGLSLGLATLSKPISLYLLVAYIILIILNKTSEPKKIKQIIFAVLIMTLSFSIVVAPWQIHNKVVHGTFQLSSIQGTNLMRWNAGILFIHNNHMEAELLENVPWSGKHHELAPISIFLAKPAPYNYLKTFEQSKREGPQGAKYILRHPFTYAGLHLRGIFHLFIPTKAALQRTRMTYYPNDDANRETHLQFGLMEIMILIYQIFLTLLLLISTTLLIKKNQINFQTGFILIVIFYFINITGILGLGRYSIRHFIIFSPLVIILAAKVISDLISHNKKLMLSVITILLALTLIWITTYTFLGLSIQNESIFKYKIDKGTELNKLLSLQYLSSDKLNITFKETIYNENKSQEGMNIFTPEKGKITYLIDMKGNIINTWRIKPAAPYAGYFTEILPNGDAIILGGTGLTRLNWNSVTLWELQGNYHHDIDVYDNITYSLSQHTRNLTKDDKDFTVIDNTIVKINNDGRKIFSQSIFDIISDDAELMDSLKYYIDYESPNEEILYINNSIFQDEVAKESPYADFLHSNSLEIIRRDVPGVASQGDILINVRNLNLIFIYNPHSDKIVWSHTNEDNIFDRGHQATLLDNNNILFYDNGFYRNYSRIVEINPITKEIVWEYKANSAESFYSQHRGGAERLPNGNTLITETTSGRTFEVTPEKEIVWQHWNPYVTKEGDLATFYRVKRVPLDFYE